MICHRARASSSWAGAGVVIPARNEERLIGATIHSVVRALRQAGLPSTIVVVAHRCTDSTEEIARRAVGDLGTVITDHSPDVAGARAAGVRRVLQHFGGTEPGRLWLLSTDADTTVPADWTQRILRHTAEGCAAVAGLAELSSWEGTEDGRQEYLDLVAAGIHGDSHVHAYAANLAVRADAYLDAGGWPRVSPGEEHALLAELEGRGWRVRRPTDVVVTTSGRVAARASGGLGDLLAGLSSSATLTPVARGAA